MKKLFTLCIALLFSCVAMNAQNFIFVDGDGNTIEMVQLSQWTRLPIRKISFLILMALMK